LINLQWHVLVLTLRLAVYTLFGKGRSNLGTNFLHRQKYVPPYTYVTVILNYVAVSDCSLNRLNLWLSVFRWFPHGNSTACEKTPD